MTETWLAEVSLELGTYDGYNSFHVVRNEARGGGVSVCVDCQYHASKIEDLCTTNENIEASVVTVNKEDFGVVVGIYRPPAGNVEIFNDILSRILNDDRVVNRNVILVGDMNINLLDPVVSTDQYVSLFQSLSFLPYISKPTRFPPVDSGAAPTLLDHIWYNKLNNCSGGIICNDITDHCPIFINIPCVQKHNKNNIKVTFRCHSGGNINSYLQDLSRVNWGNVFVGDVHEQVEIFQNVVNTIYCKSCPLKIKYVSQKRLEKPWLTSGILKSIKMKSFYFKQFKLGLIDDNFNKMYKNRLTFVIRNAKRLYYKNAFDSYKKNIKKTWQTIKHLIESDVGRERVRSLFVEVREIVDTQQIANEFNNYFSSIGQNFNEEIPIIDACPLQYVKRNANSFFLSDVTPVEVEKLISNLKLTRTDRESVSVTLLKRA